MITRSSLLHIRVPFSFFLLPVYLLALVSVGDFDIVRALIAGIVLHLFLFPASHGFNSFYDRDTGSIGGLRRPPAVTRDLLWLSLGLEAAGIAAATLAGWQFAVGCVIYGLASKAYSWDRIRLKKYGISSWLLVGLGQGTGIFLLTAAAVSPLPLGRILTDLVLPAISSGLFLLGVYPLTQIYQHREDSLRGDRTLSLHAGVAGTFGISALFIAMACACFMYYFYFHVSGAASVFFFLSLVPALVFWVRWLLTCRKNAANADFSHCMHLNLIASSGLNLFCLLWIVLSR